MTHMHIARRLAPQPCIPLAWCLGWFLVGPTLSSKCRVGFGKSVIDFHIDVGFSGEGASQVGEIICRFQWLVIHNDVWLVIHISRCRLVHDLCLLGYDVKPMLSHALEKWFTHCCVKSAVIREKEFSQCGYLHLCLCFESSEAEHSSIRSVMLKRAGARTQSCFIPFVTGNESEVSPLSTTVALVPSCNWRTSAVNFLGSRTFPLSARARLYRQCKCIG